MQRWLSFGICATAFLWGAGCTSNQQNTELPPNGKPGTSQGTRVKSTGTVVTASAEKPLEKPPEKPLEKLTDGGFYVKFETTKGDFIVRVHPNWAPLGAERFRNLVKTGFYDDCRFFRVLRKPNRFMVQFGINGNPAIQKKWRDSPIKDDPVVESNTPGRVTFATSGPDSRTTQIFINYGNNSFLDGQGFSPFAEVVEGMQVVERFDDRYGPAPSNAQPQIQQQGNAFLDRQFPGLDSVKKATIVE